MARRRSRVPIELLQAEVADIIVAVSPEVLRPARPGHVEDERALVGVGVCRPLPDLLQLVVATLEADPGTFIRPRGAQDYHRGARVDVRRRNAALLKVGLSAAAIKVSEHHGTARLAA